MRFIVLSKVIGGELQDRALKVGKVGSLIQCLSGRLRTCVQSLCVEDGELFCAELVTSETVVV